MKTKIAWLILSCLMIAALVLASCGPQATTTLPTTAPPTTKPLTITAPTTTPTKEEPKYGGTAIACPTATFAGFDPANDIAAWAINIIYESPMWVDWARGPAGTKETELDFAWTPPELWTGCLAEKWEHPKLGNYILYVRKGVKWQNIAPVSGRELTAEDFVFSMKYLNTNPKSVFYNSGVTATALDKYRVELQWPKPDVMELRLIRRFVIVPHEVVDKYGEKGFEDWHNQCGTGPFMMKDYVIGSSISWVKNPDYWMNDPFYPKNRLPYLDGLTALIIGDAATRLAALRAGKIDRLLGLTREQAESLDKTNPELMKHKVLISSSPILCMRTDLAPWNDIRVRKALSMAINRDELVRDFYKGQAELLTWPVFPNAGPVYTPFDELPAETKEILSYNPTKAKQLLAEAGHPNGFKFDIFIEPSYREIAPVLKAYFEKIGCTMEIKELDYATHYSLMVGRQYNNMVGIAWGNSFPYGAVRGAYRKGLWNYSNVEDVHISERFDLLGTTLSLDEQNKIGKELNQYCLSKCYYINLVTPYSFYYWQPWLKGYHGEYALGREYNEEGPLRHAWLDQDLKKKMTGR